MSEPKAEPTHPSTLTRVSKVISVSVSPQVYEDLAQRAKAERRSVSNLINLYIEHGLRQPTHEGGTA